MIISVSPFAKIQFWTSPPNDLNLSDSSWIESSATCNLDGSPMTRLAVIESRRAVGPRDLYGLLGAECRQNSEPGIVHFRVGITESSGRSRIPWALGAERDDVVSGITREYAPVILDAAGRTTSSLRLGGCTISFIWGGVSEVNSCAEVFRCLGSALVQLFGAVEWPPTDAEVVAALESSGTGNNRV
jgi:hypothetical protein